MSKVNRMIELKPDCTGDTREVLVSVGHRCEYCQGKKELDAVIGIQWKPTCKE